MRGSRIDAKLELDFIRKPLCEARRKAYLSENGFAKCHRSPRRCALYEQGYHNDPRRWITSLFPDPCGGNSRSACPRRRRGRRRDEVAETEGIRPSPHRRHLVCALERLPVEGCPPRLVRGLLQPHPRAFSKAGGGWASSRS